MFQFFRRFFGIVSSKDLVRIFVFIYCIDNFFPIPDEEYKAIEKKKGLDLKEKFDMQEFKVRKFLRPLRMLRKDKDCIGYISILQNFYCLDNRLKYEFIS